MKSKNKILPIEDSERQKVRPLDYMMGYFPNAQVLKSIHSYDANLKHTGEEGMEWASEKSIGDGNQIMRHLIDFREAHARGDYEEAQYHATAIAWRGDELLERYSQRMAPFFSQEQTYPKEIQEQAWKLYQEENICGFSLRWDSLPSVTQNHYLRKATNTL